MTLMEMTRTKGAVLAFLSQSTFEQIQTHERRFDRVSVLGLDALTSPDNIHKSALHVSDGICPTKTAIDQFETLTGFIFNSHLLNVRAGAPFKEDDVEVHPFLFDINPLFANLDLHLDFITVSEFPRRDPSGILTKALDRCIVSTSLERTLAKLRSDNVSGAGRLANIAVEDLASLCYDAEVRDVLDFEEWWDKLRLYAWHIAHNGRPSMAAAMKNCLVRTLKNIYEAKESLSLLAGDERAQRAQGIILSTLKETRTAGRLIPAKFQEFIACGEIWRSEEWVSPKRRRRPLTFLLHSSSRVVACSLTQLFSLSDRPAMRLFVLESRPLYEGVAFARLFKEQIDQIQPVTIQPITRPPTPPPSPPAIPSPGMSPPVTVEVAVDAAVSVYASATDVFILAADCIYPNGDVSNKIGALSAVLAMRHHGGRRKVVVIGTTDKICANDERDMGWDHSYEEVDGAQITDHWPDDLLSAGEELRVRNMLFETVPGELIDCYVTEMGVIGRERIKEIADEHLEREKHIFSGL